MAVLMVGPTSGSLVDITPDPSAMTWGLQDISASDSGRTHDAGNRMQKMRTSQKRKLNLTWTMLDDAQASAILRAFNPEYFYVRYHDAMDNAMEIREFYCGDRSAPLKWYKLKNGTRYATVSFNIIER